MLHLPLLRTHFLPPKHVVLVFAFGALISTASDAYAQSGRVVATTPHELTLLPESPYARKPYSPQLVIDTSGGFKTHSESSRIVVDGGQNIVLTPPAQQPPRLPHPPSFLPEPLVPPIAVRRGGSGMLPTSPYMLPPVRFAVSTPTLTPNAPIITAPIAAPPRTHPLPPVRLATPEEQNWVPVMSASAPMVPAAPAPAQEPAPMIPAPQPQPVMPTAPTMQASVPPLRRELPEPTPPMPVVATQPTQTARTFEHLITPGSTERKAPPAKVVFEPAMAPRPLAKPAIVQVMPTASEAPERFGGFSQSYNMPVTAPQAAPPAPIVAAERVVAAPAMVDAPEERALPVMVLEAPEPAAETYDHAVVPPDNVPVVVQPAPATEAAPVEIVQSVDTMPAPPALPAPLPERELPAKDKALLAKTPSGLGKKEVLARTPEPVIIKRNNPSAGEIPTVDVRAHEEMGLKIEVRKSDINVQHYLEEGYNNLMDGKSEIAAGYYKEVLALEPKNETAIFGLATSYHKVGRLDEAREQYTKLLKIDPTHREGLNNFMALISEQSPQEALAELVKLEERNPDFSPIKAQIGMVYNKMGDYQSAAEKLAGALALSPDNLAYKYNLAIALDRLGQYTQASDLYYELITAYQEGATLPGDINAIKERAIFVSGKAKLEPPSTMVSVPTVPHEE